MGSHSGVDERTSEMEKVKLDRSYWNESQDWRAEGTRHVQAASSLVTGTDERLNLDDDGGDE
jgi:hypothetical protein